ncbi:MAG: hypothetical protein AAGH82_01095 [Pseudomonadota bacterium]
MINIFAAFGGVATIIGLWEFAIQDRLLPYHVGNLQLCTENAAGDVVASIPEKELKEFGYFLTLNASSTVYVDMDMIDVCQGNEASASNADDGGPTMLDTENRFEFSTPIDRDYIAQMRLEVDKSQFRNGALSRVQTGLSDMSGDRILGVFFVKGNLAAGEFQLELADVGYSKELDDMHKCTRVVANAQTFPARAWHFLSTCLVGISTERFIGRY